MPLEDIVKETGFTKPTAYERIYDFFARSTKLYAFVLYLMAI